VVRTGLICAYPKIARYDGRGDPKRATSYACVLAGPQAPGRTAARQ
jgi:feruloyl esterase